MRSGLVLSSLATVAARCSQSSDLSIPASQDGSYAVIVDGLKWFESGATSFRYSSKEYSTKDGSLKLVSQENAEAQDVHGPYDLTTQKWTTEPGVNFETAIKVYCTMPGPTMAIFTQTFPDGATETSAGDRDKVISTFPSLNPAWSDSRGFVSFQGSHQGASDISTGEWKASKLSSAANPNVNDTCRVVTTDFDITKSTGHYDAYVAKSDGTYESHSKSYCNSGHVWAYHANIDEAACAAKCNEMACSCYDVKSGAPSPSTANIGTGIAGSGPVVAFTQDLKRSVVLSAFSNFMAHNQVLDGAALAYGPMGGIVEVPAGYSVSTVLSVGRGINTAMEGWGDQLLSEYGKERFAYKRDLAMQYLGFSTDNGAYYYYNTEPGKNYEETLVDVVNYASDVRLPYKYVLLDSWWYKQGAGSGVKDWDPRSDIFPDGMKAFYEKTGRWPQMLHNRMWAPDNVYMRRNGGKYHFICDEDAGHNSTRVCVPADPHFWTDLMANKSATGMFMYEQDWLHNEFDYSKVMGEENATLGRDWLMQMNEGAVNANVTIQMCMAYVRHLLQSVEMSQVTNARASRDYHPGNDQWNLGAASIVNHAIGLAPSKDNYWSTKNQTGSKWGNDTAEPHSRLQSAVLSLTTGPVAPADKIGHANVSLIMRACDSSGRLLTPDRPATEIDEHFVQQAFGSGGPEGNVWTTSVTLGCQTLGVAGKCTWQYVLGVNLQKEYDFMVKAAVPLLVAIDADSSTAIPLAIPSGQNSTILTIPSCDEDSFHLYTIAEQRTHLLGEPDKWISVSPQRFSDLSMQSGSNRGLATSVRVHGVAGEHVSVRWSTDKGIVVSSCEIPSGRVAVASTNAHTGETDCVDAKTLIEEEMLV